MNNTFNIQRFGLLLKRQWLEFGKIYLISLVVALGVIIAFYGLSLWPQLKGLEVPRWRNLGFRDPLFIIFGFIFISIIASSYFAHLGQKPKAVIDLMIPASAFEKFLAGVFFTGILATASYLLIFYLTDLVFIAKLQSTFKGVTYKEDDGTIVSVTENIRYFYNANRSNLFLPFYLVPFFVTSIFLLGSIYFNKFHYIKTAISVMIFSGIWSLIIFKSSKALFEGKILINPERMNTNMSRSTGELLGFILLLVLTLIFWSITYIRLKEKEV